MNGSLTLSLKQGFCAPDALPDVQPPNISGLETSTDQSKAILYENAGLNKSIKTTKNIISAFFCPLRNLLCFASLFSVVSVSFQVTIGLPHYGFESIISYLQVCFEILQLMLGLKNSHFLICFGDLHDERGSESVYCHTLPCLALETITLYNHAQRNSIKLAVVCSR